MDSITQAALGGVVGELVLGRKIGWRGMAWGMLFGTLPDLDVLFSPWLSVTEQLRWHRGVSHSILMMVVASFVFAKPLSLLHRQRGLSARRAGWFVFLAWSTHVLIDVFTSYGTQIYEPFSDHRVSTSNLFIIDLFFTLPLLSCLFYRLWVSWKYRRVVDDDSEGHDDPEFSRRCAAIMISLSGLYVLFSFVMKLWAVDQMRGHMADQLPNGTLVTVAPTPFNTILWRGLIETDEAYFVTYWSPFDQEAGQYDFIEKRRDLAKRFEGQKSFETLKWFAMGHWVARPGPDGKVVFIDVRFGELRNLEAKQLLPIFQWHLEFDDDGKMQARSYRPRDLKMKEALGLIWERIWGVRSRWDTVEPF